MRIKWSPTRVMENADQIERHINAIFEPLDKAKAVAVSAREDPSLPQYVKWQYDLLVSTIECLRGSLTYKVERLRDVVPKDALAEERAELAIAATRPELIPR